MLTLEQEFAIIDADQYNRNLDAALIYLLKFKLKIARKQQPTPQEYREATGLESRYPNFRDI